MSEFDKDVSNLTTAKPDPEVRKRHIQAALEEFKAHNLKSVQQDTETSEEKKSQFHQGSSEYLRPKVTNIENQRDKTMKSVKKSWLYSALGSAAVVLLGVFLVTDNSRMPSIENNPEDMLVSEALQNNDSDKVLVGTDTNDTEIYENAINETQPATEVELVQEVIVTGIRESSDDFNSSQSKALVRAPAPKATGASKPSPVRNQVATREMAQASLSQITTAQKGTAQKTTAQRKMYSADQRIITLPSISHKETSRDNFTKEEINPIKLVKDEPVSTFSIDVDTASYSYVRRQLNRGVLPQKNAVRIEEMLNYFDYTYPIPEDKKTPFRSSIVVQDSPWAKGKKLVHIGIKGYEHESQKQPDSNIIFLLDVSGSMRDEDRLPLVKQAMQLLLTQLKPTDTVGIAVYAGAAGVVLEPTPVKEKQKILAAMDKLQAGGSTAGSKGIKLAYDLASQHFNKNAVNRIFLATDGDFNVGIRDKDELKGFIERKRDKGIYLSVLGFGAGNYQDSLMQSLAQNGNGVAAYIDTLGEAQKVLVHEATSALFPIAKDVKIQVEFNPKTVSEYRLIGYETRALKREDFNNDKVDAGDIGAGHSVTAIYEVTPVNSSAKLVDDLRYGSEKTNQSIDDLIKNELAYLKIRYKRPNDNTSTLIEQKITFENNIDNVGGLQKEVHFANAVAGFAQLLKDDKYLTDWSYEKSLKLAQENKGEDEYGYRTEFIQLIRKAIIAKEW